MMQKTKRTIVWAIDVFEPDLAELRKTAHLVHQFCRVEGAHVEPVYVLFPDETGIEDVGDQKAWARRCRDSAVRAMESILKDLKLKTYFEEPKVILFSHNMKEGVKSLSTHAKAIGADLIVVNTHARSGIERLLLGSFSEMLLLLSEVPVCTVSPNSKAIDDIHRIVFATDLSDRSKEALGKIASLSKDHQSKVVLFHAIPNPVEPVLGSGMALLGGVPMPLKSYFSQQEDSAKKVLQQRCEWLKKDFGLEAEYFIEAQTVNIPERIVEFAKEQKAALIAMASQKGAIKAALLGSMTREVVRHAGVPVWIVHPENWNKEVRKKPEAGAQTVLPEGFII